MAINALKDLSAAFNLLRVATPQPTWLHKRSKYHGLPDQTMVPMHEVAKRRRTLGSPVDQEKKIQSQWTWTTHKDIPPTLLPFYQEASSWRRLNGECTPTFYEVKFTMKAFRDEKDLNGSNSAIRMGEAAKRCTEWLLATLFDQWGSKKFKTLQLAMFADAGDEHYHLMRHLDYERFPADDLSFNASAFVARAGVRALDCPNGAAPAVQTRCLKRMMNWVAAVVQTLRAEFPSFEAIQAWGVFNVAQHDRGMGARAENSANAQRHRQMERLIEAFKAEATSDELVGEMESVRHLVARVAAENSMWLWMLAGGSTSGVEQSFGKGYNRPVASLGNGACCDRMEIIELGKGDIPQVLHRAAGIWSDTGSGNRQQRSDVGGQHLRARNEGCEGCWRQERQLDAAASPGQLKSVRAVDPDAMLQLETWTRRCVSDRVEAGTGPVVVYKAALSSQRLVYMTDAFLDEYLRIATLMVDRAGGYIWQVEVH
ncbi:unnamed protein product [Prorocentrum cordatum]|uniref:Uncharacterized protein n=1 Tax=Prorocentrum cordatum TaxID=2364126 RepID=A0ABN9WV80_9DINO|nr:unnamed protein product [Polarella glacialis]